MNKFKIVVFLCFSIFLTSCFSKTEEVETEGTSGEASVVATPAEDVITVKTEEQLAQEADLSKTMSTSYVNYETTSDKYKIPKKVVNLINDNLLEFVTLNKDNFTPDKEKKPTNDSVIGELEDMEESTDQQALERTTPLVDDNLDYNIDSVDYAKKMLPEYTILARSKFTSSSAISYKHIKSFGAYIDSNFIFIKKIYDYSLGKYIYDILFLSGDINSESNPWYRHSGESTPIEETLATLKITDLNSYVNIIEKNKLPILIQEKELATNLENTNSSSTPEEDSDSSSENIEDIDTDVNQSTTETQNSSTSSDSTEISQPDSGENKNTAEEQDSSAGTSQDQITEQISVVTEEEKLEAVDIQKRLIAFRVEKVIGFWQDIHNNEIYLIKEIASSAVANKKYGAYLILESDIPPLKENTSLNWVNEDLKFDFYIKNQEGLFMNEEKMPTLVRVIPYPAKGTLALFLPNKEVRYLAPMIPSLDQEVYNDLYSEILRIQPTPANYSKKYNAFTKYSTSLPETKSSDYLFLSWTLPLGIVLLSLALL